MPKLLETREPGVNSRCLANYLRTFPSYVYNKLVLNLDFNVKIPVASWIKVMSPRALID